MNLRREILPEYFIDLALQADDELLQPGREPATLDWLNDQSLPTRKVTEPIIDYLDTKQVGYFTEDLSRPTIERYATFDAHALTRFGILQLAVASALGQPFGVEGQRNGVVVQDVFPKEDLLDRANSGLGARAGFDFHTDQAFGDHAKERPDYVSLACIRNHEGATTGLILLDDVLADLSESAIEQLYLPKYSFFRGRLEEGLGVDSGSILSDDADGSVCIRLGSDTYGFDKESTKALDELEDVLAIKTEEVVLSSGEILTFPNHKTIHERKGFEPMKSKANRRWVQKIYIKGS